MFFISLGIGRWTVLYWKIKQIPVSRRNNKDSDSIQTINSRSKPFELERQELRFFLIIASSRVALLSCYYREEVSIARMAIKKICV